MVTSLINNLNSSVSGGVFSKDRTIERIISILKRMEFSTIAGWLFNNRPVCAEPVNVTTSWQVSVQTYCLLIRRLTAKHLLGRIPDWMMCLTVSSGEICCGCRGFTIAGTPARRFTAIFQASPNRKIECIDIKSNTFHWNTNVMSGKSSILGDFLHPST